MRSESSGKTYLDLSSFSYDHSGVTIDVGFSLLNSKVDRRQNVQSQYTREASQQLIRFGYITRHRYFFGLGYAVDRHNISDSHDTDLSYQNENYMAGLGYNFINNFYGRGYFVRQKNDYNLKSYLGYRLDFGYKINLLENFFLTTAISYQQTGPVWSTQPGISLGLFIF